MLPPLHRLSTKGAARHHSADVGADGELDSPPDDLPKQETPLVAPPKPPDKQQMERETAPNSVLRVLTKPCMITVDYPCLSACLCTPCVCLSLYPFGICAKRALKR